MTPSLTRLTGVGHTHALGLLTGVDLPWFSPSPRPLSRVFNTLSPRVMTRHLGPDDLLWGEPLPRELGGVIVRCDPAMLQPLLDRQCCLLARVAWPKDAAAFLDAFLARPHVERTSPDSCALHDLLRTAQGLPTFATLSASRQDPVFSSAPVPAFNHLT